MSSKRLAFIFPAFTTDFSDHPGHHIPGFDDQFTGYLHRAALSADPGLVNFRFDASPFRQDELRTQYITFLYSCAVSSLLRKNNVVPAVTAGFSMGIYAALFDAGSVTLETALELIRIAFRSMKGTPDSPPSGMGTVIGLSEADIHQLIQAGSLRVQVTNQNAAHSFVVSGTLDDVREFMERAREEGAFHVRDLEVSIPYHSTFLRDAALNFEKQTSHLDIRDPGTPIVSLIDQSVLKTSQELRREIVRNLYHPLNWYRTMQVMAKQDISEWIECGPSTGLAKNARFVEGIRFYPLPSMWP